MFDKWKSLFGRRSGTSQSGTPDDSARGANRLPEIPRIEATDNPWKVPLLAVHTITQRMQSTTDNSAFAANAVSYGQEDGICFIGQPPSSPRIIPASLTYHTEGKLLDGALFLPQAMEQKWALFLHREKFMCVRSWQRKVQVAANVQNEPNQFRITAIQGVFTDENEPPELTLRMVDFLIRSHALGLQYPAPIPRDVANDPSAAAMWCFSLYGSLAHFATAEAVQEPPPPGSPLRTYSLLHIAAARADIPGMEAILSRGFSPDLPDRDGQCPLHWALSSATLAAATCLIEHGAKVDFRDPEGATMLMQVVQQAKVPQTTFLLNNGADPNAYDLRGFTALHRAAYLGNREIVLLLLSHGASPSIKAQGHTAADHARVQGHTAIANLLDSRS